MNRLATRTTLPLLAVLLFSSGCRMRVTHYAMLSTRRVDVPRTEGLAEESRSVKASSVVTTVGRIPLTVRRVAHEVEGRRDGSWNVDRAMKRALARTPGAVGMTDVVLYDTVLSVPFLLEYHCCTVRGRPLINPAAPARVSAHRAGTRTGASDQPPP